jgi:hypothetical protein
MPACSIRNGRDEKHVGASFAFTPPRPKLGKLFPVDKDGAVQGRGSDPRRRV